MDQKKLTIRRGNASDKAAIKAVYFQAYRGFEQVLLPESWKTMQANLEDDAAFTKLFSIAMSFLCEYDGQIAGVVFLVPHGNETPYFLAEWSYIRLLGVLPQYRGSGIADALMRKCMEQAREWGEHTLALHTSEYQHAWRIYERLGFQRVQAIGPIYGHTYWLYKLSLR